MTQPPAKYPAFVFLALWLFIIFVSVVDGYLAVRFRDELARTELNPLGRMLIRLNDGQVWLLIATKFLGTLIAATFVLLIRARWPRAGFVIIGALAAVQLWLLLYLLLT